MRSTDPKAKLVPDGFRRSLTIHDGGRLTPALVALLATLSDHVEEEISDQVSADLDALVNPTQYRRNEIRRDARSHLRPVLVSRVDGLAIYAPRRIL